MNTYAELIQTALTLPMGTQVCLTRHEVGDTPDGVRGNLVSIQLSPRMGLTTVFILWDDRERVSEYRLGNGESLNMPMHWTGVSFSNVNFATEGERMQLARAQVGELIEQQARATLADRDTNMAITGD